MVEYDKIRNPGVLQPEIRKPGEISTGGTVPAVAVPARCNETVALTTKRLTLRAPAARDLEALVALANNPRVAQNLSAMPHPYSAEDAQYWIETLSKPAVRQRTFAIIGRYTDAFFGGCGYRPMEGHPDRVLIGYWLGEPYWGQGLAAEAAQTLIDHAFDHEDIGSVWVSARTTNNQSRRVIEKCGFQYAHNGMARSLAVTGMVAIDYYSISRKTWESLHAWGEQ